MQDISNSLHPDRLLAAYKTARRDLLAEREPSGHWVGELSDSALSTATATSALAIVGKHGGGERFAPLVQGGLAYLAGCQNADGGWGDTDKSRSNIATTMLVRAALELAGAAQRYGELIRRAEAYIEGEGGIAGLRRRYGSDKTFAVPILTNCALAGLVPWGEVAQLPYEMACLPHRVLGLVRLPVVSYAIPALVAIGQARWFHRPPRNPLRRWTGRLCAEKSLSVVGRMQPASGGFLEATPLTSFVVMSLASIGQVEHAIVREGVKFLVASVRENGSWPIDTNLATWATTLAAGALDAAGGADDALPCLEWLLSCQHRKVHPFTSAAPGGWGWTDLSGAVPDADDTPGALLALAAMRRGVDDDRRVDLDVAAAAGVDWLLKLQNGDGGWPTFCRGWGALPFDRSGVDLTAHALRALHAWGDRWPERTGVIDAAQRRGLEFLARKQRDNGSWIPLWFGNQYDPAEENPVYGTARTLLAYRDLGLVSEQPAQRAVAWLMSSQNADGGWGRGVGAEAGQTSSVEETAVAVEALLTDGWGPSLEGEVAQGVSWLVRAVESGRHRETTPIGFYFARLWYYERLYPVVFTVAALGRAVQVLLRGQATEGTRTDESPTVRPPR